MSVDSDSKTRKVLGLLSRSGRDYFWTSGHKTRGDSVRWASGATLRASSRGRYPWSVQEIIIKIDKWAF